MFRTLNRNSSLPLGDKDDPDNNGQEHCTKEQKPLDTSLGPDPNAVPQRGFEHHRAACGHLSNDASHDQQADPVADSVCINLLSNPHQYDGACCHPESANDEPIPCVVLVKYHPGTKECAAGKSFDPHKALHQADNNRRVTSIFIKFSATRLSLFLECLKWRVDLSEQLENDRCRNIRHDP